MLIGLLALVQPIVPPNVDVSIATAAAEQAYIEEHELKRVRLSCYIAESGAVCADGTIPYEGVIASNYEHLGQKCVMYDNDLTPVAVWTCHDVGGNELLQAGTAIDVYRDSIERCYEMIGSYGDYVYIEWVPEGVEAFRD